MQGRLLTGLVAAAVFLVGFSPARADDAKPSWACLPEDTFMLLRIPSGNKVADVLRTKTRLGALIFDPQRVAKVREAMAKEGSDEFEQANKTLGKYGLKLDDCYKLLAGEAGMGLVASPGQPRMVVGLAWLEPEGGLSERLMGALDKLLEEADEDMIDREDIELAGQKVVHLTITPPKVEEEDVETKPGAANIHIRMFDLPKFDVLVTRKDHRLLAAVGAPVGAGEKDLDAARDRLKDIFAHFLAAHDEKDSGPKLRYLETPGLSAALPNGIPLLDFMLDVRTALKLVDPQQSKTTKSILKATGLDQLGVIAYRGAFDQPLLRSGMFISAPAPRTGVLALADQPPLNGQPPAWVPAEVISFTEFSIDLGKAYSRIKQMVIDEGGDEARANFDNLDLRVNQVLQTDMASLLSGLGTQYTILSLPPTKAGAGGDEGAAAAMGSVFVLKLSDEALWKRVLQTAAVFMQKELSEEQGFQGIRLEQGLPMPLAAFIGRGYLVVAYGAADSVETILSSLRNPPAGSAGLAGSKLVQRANELLPARPCLTVSVTDMNRYAKTLRSTLMTMINLYGGDEDADKAVIDLFRSLMPSEDELNGVLGVSTGQAFVDEQGVTATSVGELPAP